MIAPERVQAALMLFGGLIGAACCIGIVLAYCRRRLMLRNLRRVTWGRK